MTEHEPIAYPSLRACRTDEQATFTCPAKAKWVVETFDRDGIEFTDHLCGRHLAGFLEAVLAHGRSATVSADYGYGEVAP